jgi:hypothetical protein
MLATEQKVIASRGGRVGRYRGKVVGFAPAMLMASASAIALSFGVAQGEVISTPQTTPQILTNQDNTIESTITIDATTDVAAVSLPGDYSGTTVNKGTIKVTADNVGDIAGIYIDGDLLGSVINDGSIELDVADASDYSYYGIYIDGTVAAGALVENNGSIAIDMDSGESLEAAGIYVDGDVNGTVRNNGQISINLSYYDYDTLSLVGIWVDGEVNGLVENTGKISVSATGELTDSTLYATGIYLGDGIGANGTVRNTGTITVDAHNSDTYTVQASGIWADSDVSGLIENTGSISVTASGEGDDVDQIEAYGLRIDGDVTATGVIRNTGKIMVAGSGESTDVSAYGIYVEDTLDGNIVNTGTVTVSADTTGNEATAYGIYVSAGIGAAGSIDNSGTISVSASVTNDDNAEVWGIEVYSGIDGTISNSGSITASAYVGGASDATAYGIEVDTVNATGSITNTGAITAKAVSVNGDAKAYGLYASTVEANGSINNSGTIIASAQGATNDYAYGIYVSTLDGSLTNTGTIKASADIDSYAIYLASGTGTLNLSTSGTIEGRIRVSDHDVNMTSVANGSAYYEFDDANIGTGVFTTLVDGGQPWFVSGAGTDKPIYATVGTTSLSANSLELAGIVDLGSGFDQEFIDLFGGANSVGISRSGQNDPVQSPMAFGLPDHFSKFVRGSYDKFTYSDTGLEQTVGVAGLFAGGVGKMQNGLGFGVMGGMVSTSAKGANSGGATYDNESSGGILQFGIAQKTQGAVFDLGVHVGALSHENNRFVSTGSGVETASSSFNSVFYGVSLGAAAPMQMANGLRVTPSARVSATQQRLGSYTETGATANATVGSRKATITAAKIGVEVAKKLESGLLSASVELQSRHSSGDGAFDVSLFGATASGSTLSRSDSFGKIGLGYETQLSNGGNLELAASTNVGGNGIDGQAVSATYRFDF